jgi:hypothetical protein
MKGDRPKQRDNSAYIELNLKLVPIPPSTSQHKLILQLYNQDTYDVYLKHHLLELAEHVIDLKAYPRQKIVVSFEILSNDGSLLSICTNAFMKCVINSGIAAKSMGMAYSVAKIAHNDETIYKFDPTLHDEVSSSGLLTMTLENLQYLHDIVSGESFEKRQFLRTKIHQLKQQLKTGTALMNDNEVVANASKDGSSVNNAMKLAAVDAELKQYVKELSEISDEPKIIQFESTKEWSSDELEECMTLIIQKWIQDDQNLRL